MAPDSLTIPQLVQKHASVEPEKIALVADGRASLTYAALYDHMQSMASSFLAAGIGRNDRLAVVLPNGPEMASAFLSISAVATCAPLNPAFREAEFEFYLADLEAKAIVVKQGDESPAAIVAQRMGIGVVEIISLLDQPAGIFTLAVKAEPAKSDSLVTLQKCSAEEDIALILHTSGTTSRPKMVPLLHANVCTSARNIQHSLALSPNDRCLNVMPLFHIHGLVGALLSSIASGGSIICTNGFNPDQFFSVLDRHMPTWYTAVPTIHQAILTAATRRPASVPRHRLRFIRSSSSSLPPTVMQELERTFGVPAIESYGMTEAAHQMTSNPLPPAVRKPGSVGLPAGPEIAIMDDSGQLLLPGATGEIVIRGPSITNGYSNNPQANESAFQNGWFRTGDRGRMDNDGYFYITGRTKEMINRGGENISPREIDEVLLQHHAIAEAVAFSVPHERLCEDVVAAVILKTDADATEQELREYAMSRLAHFKVPSQIVFITEMPKGPTGKVQRIGMYEKLKVRLRLEFVEAATVAEVALAELWQEVLGLDRVGIHDNFFGLGGDSLVAAQLVARINDQFELDVSVASVFRFPTICGQGILIETELLDQIERVDS